MGELSHWTQESIDDFVYSISASYTAQLEVKMEEQRVSQTELANRLKKTTGRVSQVLNDPGNLGLKVIVEYAKALGMKVSIVAYDDGDPGNSRGPIRPEVFVKCWEKAKCPTALYEVEAAPKVARRTKGSMKVIVLTPVKTEAIGTPTPHGKPKPLATVDLLRHKRMNEGMTFTTGNSGEEPIELLTNMEKARA